MTLKIKIPQVPRFLVRGVQLSLVLLCCVMLTWHRYSFGFQSLKFKYQGTGANNSVAKYKTSTFGTFSKPKPKFRPYPLIHVSGVAKWGLGGWGLKPPWLPKAKYF